jgi:hypothetical protein
MMTPRIFWIALTIILSFAGARILLDSIRHPGQYADEYVLLGGTLSATGLVPVALALQQYLQRRPPADRLRHGTHPPKRMETKL